MEAVPWNVAVVRSYLGPGVLSSWAGRSPSRPLPALLQVGAQLTMAARCKHGKSYK